VSAADNADASSTDVERASDVNPGWIVVLNGPPRSGKSSIVDVIQETFDGPWLNLGVDVGHHDAYAKPLHVLPDAARRLSGLPALLVGVRCPLHVIMQRRNTGQPGREGRYRTSGTGGEIPEPVRRWQREVHQPGIYDLEIDTSAVSPEIAAAMVRERLDGPAPTALRVLAERR
jgi:chloramphenicol 3-O phosphotransferase